MATQYDPIAKDASLNTTENPSRNLADVIAQSLAALIAAMPATVLNNLADVVITLPSDGQTLKYDSATQKWVNANDAGGHTIENPAGTDMTQRANLQFADAHLTDDSVNDRTEVENIKDITSADYANATEDGFYNVTDESDEELTAADIPYDSNDSIGEKIDELTFHVETVSRTSNENGWITKNTGGKEIIVLRVIGAKTGTESYIVDSPFLLGDVMYFKVLLYDANGALSVRKNETFTVKYLIFDGVS